MIKGKALLVTERTSEKHWDVCAFIQSCSGTEDHLMAAEENFQLLEYDCLPLPNCAHKLAIGEVVRVHVVFEFSFSTDYFGEHDVDLEYSKQRVLRRQYPKPKYLKEIINAQAE